MKLGGSTAAFTEEGSQLLLLGAWWTEQEDHEVTVALPFQGHCLGPP